MSDRLAEIEETLAHQTRMLDEMSDVVREQWREIERLNREIARLEALIERAADDPGDDPPPPHY